MFFDLDITLRPGDRDIACRIASAAKLTALVGASGAGKTSVLNAIAGLLTPSSGHIRVANTTLFERSAGINLAPEKRRAGYVFQDNRLFPHRRVVDNLRYGMRFGRPENRLIAEDEVLALLGIKGLLNRWPATLSGGEARRVAIGRALLCAPDFLLLDEPFSALDRGRVEALAACIENLRDTLSIPILLVSHAPADVERLAGDIVVIAGQASLA